MCGSMLSRGRPKLLALSLFVLAAGAAHAQLSGAIFTSTKTGATVNGNIYTDATNVYLNGGPQNTSGGSALVNGVYIFQVTNPSGSVLLSTTNASDRGILVTNGRFAGRCDITDGHLLRGDSPYNGDGTKIVPHPEGPNPSVNGGVPVQLWPYLQTPNNGGEYKAWLVLWRKSTDPSGSHPYSSIDPNHPTQLIFAHRYAKTDNFKIKLPPPPPPAGRLIGTKFFDLNNNGTYDQGSDPNNPYADPPLDDFIIKITLNPGKSNEEVHYVRSGRDAGVPGADTPSLGEWMFPPANQNPLPGGTTYKVSEILPPDSHYVDAGLNVCSTWLETTPGVEGDPTDDRGYSGTISGDVSHLDFGNTATVKISGTKFYDRNMNGVKDPGEEVLAGFKINVHTEEPDGSPSGKNTKDYQVTTDSNGDYSTEAIVTSDKHVADGGSFPASFTTTYYRLSEASPGGSWQQTGPAGNLYEGNVVVGPKDGTQTFLDANNVLQLASVYTVQYCQDDITDKNFGNIQRTKLFGYKWYDTNTDGVWDHVHEPTIQGFKIIITVTLPNAAHTLITEPAHYTDANGRYQSTNCYPEGSTYVISEVLPNGNWHQTFPGTAALGKNTGTIPSGTPADNTYTIPSVGPLNFGNYFVQSLHAHTKGYWHNQNGYATMNDGGTIVPELQMLNALCLVRLNGSAADFNTVTPSAGFTDFSNWITNDSNGSNMACQLSAQLAAMELNVEAGFVAGSQLIYAPGTNSANSQGIATLSDLMAEANQAVCDNPLTVTSSAARAHQTALEQALDNGNNNLNWVGLPIVIVPPY